MVQDIIRGFLAEPLDLQRYADSLHSDVVDVVRRIQLRLPYLFDRHSENFLRWEFHVVHGHSFLWPLLLEQRGEPLLSGKPHVFRRCQIHLFRSF